MENRRILDIIDFNQDYYAIMGVEKDSLPLGKDPSSKRDLRIVLQKAYHTKLFEVHPDKPTGDEEKFKLVVRAYTILSDPILRNVYDRGGIADQKEESGGFSIDMAFLGTYRKSSMADLIGCSLFNKILDESGIEGMEIKFMPEDEHSHNYQWEFIIPGLPKELVLAIIEDEEEVLKLTSGEDEFLDEALPFKIYICLPSIKLVILREADEFVEEVGHLDIVKGKIEGAKFLDADLLGTTQYETAVEFITSGGLKAAVDDCIEGNVQKYIKQYKKVENQEIGALMSAQEANKIDQTQLKELLKTADETVYGTTKSEE